MEIQKNKNEAPIIRSIKYYHNVKREDKSIGSYIIVEFSGDYNTQVINVQTKVDVNSLDKTIKLDKTLKSDIITIYDIDEQEGKINE